MKRCHDLLSDPNALKSRPTKCGQVLAAGLRNEHADSRRSFLGALLSVGEFFVGTSANECSESARWVSVPVITFQQWRLERKPSLFTNDLNDEIVPQPFAR